MRLCWANTGLGPVFALGALGGFPAGGKDVKNSSQCANNSCGGFQHGEYLICQEVIAAATAAGSLSEDGGAPIG